MSRNVVFVDTSVWIEFFNRPRSVHHAAVADLLDADRVAVSGVVAAELIRGCKTVAEMDEVEDAIAGVLRIDLAFSDWLAIGRELGELRQRGVAVSLTDASVVHAARAAGLPLYALDSDFSVHWPRLARFEPPAASP